MMKLSDSEKEARKDNDMYFKNGKPKRKYMLCRSPEYQAEVRSINGYVSIDRICGGLRCPLYSIGCDDKGQDWDRS